MIADYNKSTQKCKWTFSKEVLLKDRENPNLYARIRILLADEMTAFGVRLNSRQRVISTAQVFLSRMLVRTKIGEINPYLLMATCMYVAARAEEQPVHLKTVCSEARQHWPNYMPVEPWHLAECEFYLLAEIDTCLIVHHPYTPLMKFSRRFQLAQTELQACWALINDTYATDIPLIYKPSEIAFTSIYMILVLKPGLIANRTAESVKKRLESLSIFMAACKHLNLRAVMGCIQEVLSMYALKSQFQHAEVTKELRALL